MTRFFNPHLALSSPFPVEDIPTLFVWLDRIRPAMCADDVPMDIDTFVGWQVQRMKSPNVETWGIFKDAQPVAFLEAHSTHLHRADLEPALRYIAQVSCVFKRDFWGLKNTVPALNLGLNAIFDSGVQTVFFRNFKHNKPMVELFRAVGARGIGEIECVKQNGIDVQTEMWALPAREWESANLEYLQEAAAIAAIV